MVFSEIKVFVTASKYVYLLILLYFAIKDFFQISMCSAAYGIFTENKYIANLPNLKHEREKLNL